MRGRKRHRAARTLAVGFVAVSGAALVSGCSSTTTTSSNSFGVTASPRVVAFGQPVPDGGGYYKVGGPYKIAGRTYKPAEDLDYDEVGLASWYGTDFHGRKTANGEIFDMADLSAAHPTLPLPTYARVTNLENGRSVVVRVNDRGPFAHGRLIDVSKRTADILDFRHDGTVKVRVQYVGMAPLEGNDGQWLTTTVRHDGNPVGPVMMASLTPPPPPPQEPQAAYLQTATYTPASGYTTSNASAYPPQPVQASFTSVQSDLPTPRAPVGATGSIGQPPAGGNVTYRWVSGYAGYAANAAIAQAFSAFDADQEIVLIVVERAPVMAEIRSDR